MGSQAAPGPVKRSFVPWSSISPEPWKPIMPSLPS
jgi:hypothetical protein